MAKKGCIPWWIKASKPNPAQTSNSRKKISKSNKGKIPWNKGIPRTTDEKKKMSITHKTITHSGQFKKGHKTNNGRKHTIKSISNMRKSAIEKKFVMHIIENSHIRPTHPEKDFMKICEEEHLPFKYVGDGKFWVGRLNPDFITIEESRIAVDIFGDYWHSPLFNNNIGNNRTYEERKKIFREYGWKLVIIWESELNNRKLVLKKLDDVKADLEVMNKILN